MLKLATKFAPQPAAFELAHRAGFRHAELWLDAAVLADADRVLALARHYPFGYALHYPNRLDGTAEQLRQAVALYQGLNSRCLIIHEPMYERHADALLRLDPHLLLAVENHNMPPEGFARWAERFSGLTLDVEHLWKFTLRDAPLPELLGAVRDFLGRYAGKLHHVHLPGYLPGYREHRPMYCAREMIFPALSLLEEAAFEGLIVSEANPEYQNANELRMDVLLFDTWRDRHAARG
jgi:hypothetical protein